jgi:hypothetical protein
LAVVLVASGIVLASEQKPASLHPWLARDPMLHNEINSAIRFILDNFDVTIPYTAVCGIIQM